MQSTEEHWLPVVGYEGLYEVSSLGRIRNSRGHVKSLNDNPNGYRYVTLCKQGLKRTYTVHGVVARAFLEPAPGREVCHNNGDRRDNRSANLRYDSRSQNHWDKWSHGTMMHGEGHTNHVLTAEQVLAIRSSGDRQCDLARRFGVTATTIKDILNRKTWRWLKGDYARIS